jgi:hypothetical protein
MNKPTLTAKSSLNSDLAQRLYGQASLTGESVLDSSTIPNPTLDVNENRYSVLSRRKLITEQAAARARRKAHE